MFPQEVVHIFWAIALFGIFLSATAMVLVFYNALRWIIKTKKEALKIWESGELKELIKKISRDPRYASESEVENEWKQFNEGYIVALKEFLQYELKDALKGRTELTGLALDVLRMRIAAVNSLETVEENGQFHLMPPHPPRQLTSWIHFEESDKAAQRQEERD